MPRGGPLSGLSNDDSPRLRLFVVLGVVSLALFTFSARAGSTGPIEAVRGVVQTLVSPVRSLGTVITLPFQGLANVAQNLTASNETLSELREENERLVAENATLKESALAAERLEALFALSGKNDLVVTGARVISGSVDSSGSQLMIDKGSLQGLAVGMPVTDSLGVVGQISECSPSTSVIRLITDERSGVSALAQKTRVQGELVGAADGNLRLEFVPTDKTVEVGDTVVTSGLGGTFPKGLPLGVVTSVVANPGGLYQSIIVRPLAFTSAFEEVLVITEVRQSQLADAEAIADAESQAEATTQNPTQTEGSDTAGDGGTGEAQ